MYFLYFFIMYLKYMHVLTQEAKQPLIARYSKTAISPDALHLELSVISMGKINKYEDIRFMIGGIGVGVGVGESSYKLV